MKVQAIVICSSLVILMSACSSSNSPEIPPGNLSIAISDSPMSGVEHVRLVLDEMVMTNSEGQEYRFPLGDVAFNLLDYQGMDSYMVVNGLELFPDQYHNVHFTVRQQDGNQGSWVENSQGRFDLLVDDMFLSMQDFNIGSDQHLSMTMEINLYRSLSYDDNVFQLHHDGIYSIDNRRMGHLIGEVDPQWIMDCESEYADLALEGGLFSHMAYLYPNNVTTQEQMADISQDRVDQRTPPISISPISQDMDSNWHFEMGYLAEGEYQLGYTCLGHLDDPQMDDINQGQFIIYRYSGEAVVESGENGGHQNVHQFGNGHSGGHGGGHGG